MSEPICIIVTGLSGAGKSVAIDTFEDFGFFCVDNLPMALIPKLMDLCKSSTGKFDRLALGLHIRAGEPLSEFFDKLPYLTQAGYSYKILYLDSSEEVLIRRYSATRRKHPIDGTGTIRDRIAEEREILKELKNKADTIIDTSNLTPQRLRNTLTHMFLKGADRQPLVVTLISFGYKNGLPLDADLVFDMRFLPNPFYQPKLQHLTGDDSVVGDYLLKSPSTHNFLKEFKGLMELVIPGYIHEGKTTLTIALGCTGGKHRSVFMANQLQGYFHAKGSDAQVIHRDIGKE